MSGPIQSLADPMSPYNTSKRYFQAKRKKEDEARCAQVNKEYEKALDKEIKFSSKQLECKGQDKAKQLTPQQIEYRRGIDRMCDELARERREEQKKFHKEIEQDFSCTIL